MVVTSVLVLVFELALTVCRDAGAIVASIANTVELISTWRFEIIFSSEV
jgi:hypothetical protein